MELNLNLPSDELLRRVTSKTSAVASLVAARVAEAGISLQVCHLDHALDDPFAVDFIPSNHHVLSYEAGISLAVRIQDALREAQLDAWRVRILVQPNTEDLVMDYVTWLVIDVVRIVEHRGGRQAESFNSIEEFQCAYWGSSAA
jgi:hypothetical protein